MCPLFHTPRMPRGKGDASHHDDPSGATESQDAATEARNPSSQRQDPSEGMSPSWSSLGQMAREVKYVSAVWSHHQRQGRDHWGQQVGPEETGDRRGEASFQLRTDLTWCRTRSTKPRGCWKRPTWKCKQPRAKCWERRWRKCPRSRNCWRRTWRQPINDDRSEETFVGRHQKDKKHVGRWYEAIKEEEKLQSSKDITVQCIDFCEATPSDLRGGTVLQHPRVLVATDGYQENPHRCLQILHAATFQVLRGADILLRVLPVTESQEAQGLLDEIQQQPSAFVLSGPAVVITNVATASAFPADGWSTESVSRVVRTARTRQENNERERAEHAYYSHIHAEVTISDAFPVTGQGLDESENLTENTMPEGDQEYETEQSSSDSLQTRTQISRIDENMGTHQIAH